MIKAWDFIYDKCKDCKQNIPGTGRSVVNYLGNSPMTHNELEKIRYVHHKTWDRITMWFVERTEGWLLPTGYVAAAVVFLLFWIMGVI